MESGLRGVGVAEYMDTKGRDGVEPHKDKRDFTKIEMDCVEKVAIGGQERPADIIVEKMNRTNNAENIETRFTCNLLSYRKENYKSEDSNRSFKKKHQVSQSRTPPNITVFSIADPTKNSTLRNSGDALDKVLLGRQCSENWSQQQPKVNTSLQLRHSYPGQAKETFDKMSRRTGKSSESNKAKACAESFTDKKNRKHSLRNTKIRSSNEGGDRSQGVSASDASKPVLHIAKLQKESDNAKKSRAKLYPSKSSSSKKRGSGSAKSASDTEPSAGENGVEPEPDSGNSKASQEERSSSELSSSLPVTPFPQYWSRREKMKNAPCLANEF